MRKYKQRIKLALEKSRVVDIGGHRIKGRFFRFFRVAFAHGSGETLNPWNFLSNRNAFVMFMK